MEPVTAIGCCWGAYAVGVLDSGITVGAILGGSKLAQVWGEAKQKYGLHNSSTLKRHQRRIKQRWEARATGDWVSERDLIAADERLAACLFDSLPPAKELGMTIVDSQPYPVKAARMIVDRIAEREDCRIFREEGEMSASVTARAFALEVVEASLEAALKEPEYAQQLFPGFLDDIGTGLHRVEEAVKGVDKRVRDLRDGLFARLEKAQETLDSLASSGQSSKNRGLIAEDIAALVYRLNNYKLSEAETRLIADLGGLRDDEWKHFTQILVSETGSVTDAAREIEGMRRRRTILERTIVALKQIILDRRKPDDFSALKLFELEAMYTAVAIISGPDLYQAYTEQSFDYELWQQLIKQPQNLTKSHASANHLHFSNLLSANHIVRDLILRHEAGNLCSGDTIRLLEAGSGGCNTSYAVLHAIQTDPTLKRLRLRIEFLAFEINERFANWGNGLFEGRCWPGIDDDPRIETLNHTRINPWPISKRYVRRGDAAKAISTLLTDHQNEVEASVDYFISSYMIHHVPNGDALLRFLFGPRQLAIHRKYADLGGEGQARQLSARTVHFLKLLLEGDEQKNGDQEARIKEQMRRVTNATDRQSSDKLLENVIEAVAYSLAWHLFEGSKVMRDGDVDFLEKRIAASTWSSARKSANPYALYWAMEFFHDPQRTLFSALKRLLKPGGMMLIADPDGTSSFNAENSAKNDQMATELMVAEFRNFARLSEVLSSNPLFFEVDEELRVVETRDGEYDLEKGPKGTLHEDLKDANLGYVLSARKRQNRLLDPDQFGRSADG